MPHPHLTVELDGATAIVTLNRPEQRNALSLELMQALIACLSEIENNPSIHAVILAAAGRAYCSGHDLREMVGRGVEDYRRIFDVCSDLMQKIQSIPQPVIAEVQGIATAAGCQLVTTCDLAIASEQASFATPGVRIGLFCSTPMVAVSRAIGRKRALEMLLTGEPIDASRAADWGLINSVVPASQLREATRKLRLHQGSDDRQRPGRRCPGGNFGVPRQARRLLVRPVVRRSLPQLWTELSDCVFGLQGFL
jgi:enoyl-CoA hydratase/carnithine racemase